MDMTLDFVLPEKINEDKLTPMINLISTTTEGNRTLVVANGTTNPPPVSSFVTHGKNKNPVFSEFCKYVKEYNAQQKLQTSESLQKIKEKNAKKRICLFLPDGWHQLKRL